MSSYAIKRLLSIIPTLFLVATLVFILVRIVPGGPFDQERAVPVEVQRQLDAKYHLNDPVLKQYGDWLPCASSPEAIWARRFKYPNRTVTLDHRPQPARVDAARLLGDALRPRGRHPARHRRRDPPQNTWKDTAAMGVAHGRPSACRGPCWPRCS